MNLRAFNLGRAFAIGEKYVCTKMAQDSELVELYGKKGRWITSKGAHVFIEEGKSNPFENIGVKDDREESPLVNGEISYWKPEDYTLEELYESAKNDEWIPPFFFKTRFGVADPDETTELVHAVREGTLTSEQWDNSVYSKLADWLNDNDYDELTEEEKKFVCTTQWQVIHAYKYRKEREQLDKEKEEERRVREEEDWDDEESVENDPYFRRLEKFCKHFFPDDELEGEEYFQAIDSWFNFSDLLRGDDADEAVVRKIEEFMERAPKYDGELWRGISLKQRDIDRLRSGKPWTDKSLTSWTNNEEKAKDYVAIAAPKGKNLNKVVLHIKGIGGAVDIGKYSPYEEDEVIVPKGVSYIYQGETMKGRILHIDVKRVE